MRANRIVIPTTLRAEVLKQIHSGHQGIHKCCEWALSGLDNLFGGPSCLQKLSCSWTTVRNVGKLSISICSHSSPQSCQICLGKRCMGTDLFMWNKSNYLLMVHYYSRYVKFKVHILWGWHVVFFFHPRTPVRRLCHFGLDMTPSGQALPLLPSLKLVGCGESEGLDSVLQFNRVCSTQSSEKLGKLLRNALNVSLDTSNS